MAGGSRKPRKGAPRTRRTSRGEARPQPSHRDRERMYQVLFEEASDAVFLLDAEGRFREVNRLACESLGYAREELLRMGVGDVELDLDLEAARSRRAASRPGRPTTLQGRHRRKDGTIFPVEVRAAEVDLGGERLTVAFARDVTGRKLAEQALLTSEAYFRAVFQGSSAAMAVVEPDGTVALANDAFCELAGRPREALEGASWPGFVSRGDLERMKDYNRRRLQGAADVPSRYEFQIVRADGAVRDCLLSVSFIGTERRVLASFVDVTDLKAAQRDLRAAHEELQRHLTNTPLGVITWDRDYRVRSFSGQAERIFGWRADEVLGRRADEIAWVPEDEWPRVREVIRQMEEKPGASHVMVNRNLRKDGTVIRCEWHNSSLHGADGKLSSVFSLVQDVTALDAAQQQLQVASRLAALGTLV
ncbi:MAG TPA: PAS domain S-box protein, partial [Anaeromyxobacteraceae bacterium]|nr:PAS domain S-box protein [Anaeromyxobacteraceae bacterium]